MFYFFMTKRLLGYVPVLWGRRRRRRWFRNACLALYFLDEITTLRAHLFPGNPLQLSFWRLRDEDIALQNNWLTFRLRDFVAMPEIMRTFPFTYSSRYLSLLVSFTYRLYTTAYVMNIHHLKRHNCVCIKVVIFKRWELRFHSFVTHWREVQSLHWCVCTKVLLILLLFFPSLYFERSVVVCSAVRQLCCPIPWCLERSASSMLFILGVLPREPHYRPLQQYVTMSRSFLVTYILEITKRVYQFITNFTYSLCNSRKPLLLVLHRTFSVVITRLFFLQATLLTSAVTDSS